VLQNSGADYYTLAATGSTPYANGDAARLVIDAAAVYAQLGNMTTAVQNLLAAANDGTLSSVLVDHTGAVTAAPGILDGDDVFHSWGILDGDGVFYSWGILESEYAYYILESEFSSPYLLGAAAQKVTDAAFLETNKDEIIEDDTDISAEFGVSGLAVAGSIDPADIVSLDYIKDGVERYLGSETYGSYPTTEASFAAGKADQLATDILAVTAELGNMTTAVVNLLDAANDGTLNMSLYTLRTDVTSTLNTNKDEMIVANTNLQAAYSCDAGTAAGGGGAALSRVRLGM
jgi:hypothetical protein